MRLAPTLLLPFLAALLAPFSPATAALSHGAGLHTSPTRTIARLQHHQPRSLIDICVNIPQLAVNLLNTLGLNVQLCLCLKDLDLYLETTDNVTLQNNALLAVNALINGDGYHVQCGPLPAHAKHACTTDDPCAITCLDGYVLSDDKASCVCPWGTIDCKGQCVSASAGCSGASPVARSLKARDEPITTLEAAQKRCGSLKVCGVADPSSKYEFDCVDTTSNFDSCGDCVFPHPFQSGEQTVLARGVDCGRILNARHVSCHQSRCAVQSCRKGYVLSGDECVPHGAEKRALNVLGLLTVDTGSSASSSSQVIAPALGASMVGTMGCAAALKGASGSIGGTSASDAVAPVLSSVSTMLGSTTASSLASNVDASVDATTDLKSQIEGCNCSDGLGSLLKDVDDLLNHLLNLQGACNSAGGSAPTVPGDQNCLYADAHRLVCDIDPDLYIAPISICGLLGPELNNDVQNIVNSLGLGLQPRDAPGCLLAPPTGSLPAAPPVSAPASGPVAVSAPAVPVVTPSVPSTPASPSTPAPPSTPVDPSSPDIVIYLAGITIDLALQLSAAAGSLDPNTCGGDLITLINNLVKSLLGKPLLGKGAIISRDLLGLDGTLDSLGLGGGSLDGLTSDLGLGSAGCALSLCGLTPTINGVVSALGLAPSSCNAGSLNLGPLLDDLDSAVQKLLGSAAGCGCASSPAVTSAIAGLQANATTAGTANIARAERAVRRAARAQIPRRHHKLRRADSNSVLAPALVGPMTTALTVTVSLTNDLPAGAPKCDTLLSSLNSLFGSTPTTLTANIYISLAAAKTYLTELEGCGCDSTGLSKLVQQLVDSLNEMLGHCKNNSPTVSSTGKCPEEQAVCGLLPGLYLSSTVRCAMQDVTGVASTACLTVPSLVVDTSVLLPTSSSPAVSADPQDALVVSANQVLALALKINLACGNLPAKSSDNVLDLNAAVNALLQYLVGDDLLHATSLGNVGGALGGILSGSDGLELQQVSVDSLVQEILAALGLAGADPHCGCNSAVNSITADVNALGPAVTQLLHAGTCNCGNAALLGLFSSGLTSSVVNGFKLLRVDL
ncbi:unnamed protein product [Mycena citricolor]|uniref:Protein CPL1-like domain-containing protein n=1 Tax=Mycena citricolor TaxID=2018698 RepID=A0AAD2GR88_9AGAR|nr:unnamed protein product [Mycena citricolor]